MGSTLWRELPRKALGVLSLPPAARAERRRDRLGLHGGDPGSEAVLAALVDWLFDAQDHSLSADGGSARDYSLIGGWSASYPETTGYIVPSLIAWGRERGSAQAVERARRMADWLVSIQLPSGAFQGGKIDSRPVVPVAFNTGQVLLGLAAAEAAFGGYREPMRRAADWLVEMQDGDGCWRKYPSPFAAQGEKEYETHVAWGLFEAARIDADRGYARAGLANVGWALDSQLPNGWFSKCCLDEPTRPLTHTLGYALRGVLEAYRFQRDSDFLAAARRTGDGLLSAQRDDGSLPGRLSIDWSAAASWICLTGLAQVAHCWLLLYRHTGERRYAAAGFKANAFLRRTVRLDAPTGIRGGVKGSFPVDGGYCAYEFPNWAAKFVLDSLMLEVELRAERRAALRTTTEAARPAP